MADIYIHLTYAEWKEIEKACRDFHETVHTTVTGFYHKSFRIPFKDGAIEFHDPAVRGAERRVGDYVSS